MAGQNVTINIRPNVVFSQSPSAGAGTGVSLNIPEQILCILGNGVLTDQIDLLYPGSSTQFTGTTPQTLDLTSLTDIFGNAVDFARLRGYLWTNRSTTDGVTLTVTPGASNGNVSILGTGSSLIIPASTVAGNTAFVIGTAPNTTGYAVSGTTKTLTFTPSATLISDIWFWGAHS